MVCLFPQISILVPFGFILDLNPKTTDEGSGFFTAPVVIDTSSSRSREIH